MINWTLKTIKIKDLKNHPKNPRQITKHRFQHLEGLIAKYGLIDKPIVNQDMTLIAGHQRIRILKKMKTREVECSYPDRQLEENEVEELLIGHNLHQGAFDYDILANEYEALDLLGYGFSEEELTGCFDEEEEKKSKKDKKNKSTTCPSCGHQF